jgi:hypothetical protein
MKLALYTISLRTILASFLFLSVVRADDSESHHHDFGQIHFPVSCTPEAQKTFEHGVALLHSFWYDEAGKAFSRATIIDPACAMAY